MVPASYHDFFGGCATVAGALIGLLFVAISVSPEKLAGDTASPDHQVKAGAAFSAFVNTLVIALVALLPGTGLDDWSIALASTALASTVGLIILLWREHKERIRLGQVFLLVVLIVLYGLQLANGIQLDDPPAMLTPSTTRACSPSSSSSSPSRAPGSSWARGTRAFCRPSQPWPSGK